MISDAVPFSTLNKHRIDVSMNPTPKNDEKEKKSRGPKYHPCLPLMNQLNVLYFYLLRCGLLMTPTEAAFSPLANTMKDIKVFESTVVNLEPWEEISLVAGLWRTVNSI